MKSGTMGTVRTSLIIWVLTSGFYNGSRWNRPLWFSAPGLISALSIKSVLFLIHSCGKPALMDRSPRVQAAV